ncbi:sensor histidine kinase [Frondihabitans cladoniiphilus]|uniref:histidine kinase n=1 Tax=Frondihabitans cladoniiphilus TaxID=715785 RepID=A0ABP8VWG1_9MICO
MKTLASHLVPARWNPRTSARLRLTATFTALILTVGAAILVTIFLIMSFVPQYDFSANPGLLPDGGTVPLTETESGSPAILMDEADPADAEVASLAVVTISDPAELRGLLLSTSAIVFAFVLVGGAIASWIVAGRVLRPVEQLTEAARKAADGRLDHRIAHDGAPDELGRLAETFDDMLERLQRSFEAQRRFASNASHELRTPLATTQALLDVALLDPDDFDRETLTTKLRETNTRNIQTVEALLALSDAQAGTTATEPVELDEIAREVVASSLADAAERDVTIHSTILAGRVIGDATLVRLLVGNLVGNAIRYNVHGGDVWLTVADGVVRVENTGVAIADDDLPRLTEPFFRAAGRVTNSHGLGLALVDAISRGHRASLRLDARPGGGLVVTVTFP